MTFLTGKLAWTLLRPSNLLLLCLALGLALQLVTRRRRGLALLALTVLALCVSTALPLGRWATLPLEERFAPPASPPDRVDGVVVLGGATADEISRARGQPNLGSAAERLTSLVELARRYPDARILFTGGIATLSGAGVPEAEFARRLLEQLGLPPGRVEFEDRARTTHENASLTLARAAPKDGQRWLLVTSAKHMPRAVGVFRYAGWPELVPWPVDYRTTGKSELLALPAMGERLAELDEAAHEWFGLLYYRALGHTDEVFPGPRPEAARDSPPGT